MLKADQFTTRVLVYNAKQIGMTKLKQSVHQLHWHLWHLKNLV